MGSLNTSGILERSFLKVPPPGAPFFGSDYNWSEEAADFSEFSAESSTEPVTERVPSAGFPPLSRDVVDEAFGHVIPSSFPPPDFFYVLFDGLTTALSLP